MNCLSTSQCVKNESSREKNYYLNGIRKRQKGNREPNWFDKRCKLTRSSNIYHSLNFVFLLLLLHRQFLFIFSIIFITCFSTALLAYQLAVHGKIFHYKIISMHRLNNTTIKMRSRTLFLHVHCTANQIICTSQLYSLSLSFCPSIHFLNHAELIMVPIHGGTQLKSIELNQSWISYVIKIRD